MRTSTKFPYVRRASAWQRFSKRFGGITASTGLIAGAAAAGYLFSRRRQLTLSGSPQAVARVLESSASQLGQIKDQIKDQPGMPRQLQSTLGSAVGQIESARDKVLATVSGPGNGSSARHN